MRPHLLYLVSRNTKYAFLQQGKIFLATLLIEPVDNFCYTDDRNVLSSIPQVSQKAKLCYPQTVDNLVDNFCKPTKSMLKRHRTKTVQPLKRQAFLPVGIL